MTGAPGISSVRPLWAIEGARVTIAGQGFTVDPSIPGVTVGDRPARVVHATLRALTVLVPDGLPGGHTPVRVDGVPGETAFVEVGRSLATGLHLVDSPAFDADGHLFATFSGSRGQQGPVSIYVILPDGTREAYVTDLPNPTSLAFDPRGVLHVSSRFEGQVYRVDGRDRVRLVAGDLGTPCGLAFDRDGALFIGDRSGTILRLADAIAHPFATLPPSVAAYHLAFGPDGALYVAAPTLASSESVYRIDMDGTVSRYGPRFGRPQGLAFDDRGRLYVADSLAGAAGGLFRIDPERPDETELLVRAPGIVGLAFDPGGGLVLATTDTLYRLDVAVTGAPVPARPATHA